MHLLTTALAGLFLLSGAGSAQAATTSPVLQAPIEPAYTVSMTAYNAVKSQTDDDPFITASGAYSNPNIVAARSIDLASKLPFGTVIAIESATSSRSCGYGAVGSLIGLRVIADSMNAKMRDKIDILLPQKETIAKGRIENPALVLGVCKDVTIKVVGHIDTANMPTTQSELADDLDFAGTLADAN